MSEELKGLSEKNMEDERLKKCIECIRNSQEVQFYDETTVEHAVVTPILKDLGWPISNKDGIKLRYQVGNDKVDYALFIKGKARVFIEVKRGGLQFDEKELKQILNYADYEGVEMAVLTNGSSWWFYLPKEGGRWEDRKFCTLDLLQDNIDLLIAKFSNLLSKSKVENEEYLRNAKEIQEALKREKIISDTLPKAWDKIINDPDQRLLDLLADATEQLCDYKPDAVYLKKFLATVGERTLVPRQSQPPIEGSYQVQTGKREGILVCEGKGAYALGRSNSDGFWVLKGSTAVFNETKTMPLSAKKSRDSFKKEGALKAVGNFYEFTSDLRFNSPSAAACVVLARSANGKIEWKAKGK